MTKETPKIVPEKKPSLPEEAGDFQRLYKVNNVLEGTAVLLFLINIDIVLLIILFYSIFLNVLTINCINF